MARSGTRTASSPREGAGLNLTLASSSDLPTSGLFGTGMGITEETKITVLPGGAIHSSTPALSACSVVVAEPSRR